MKKRKGQARVRKTNRRTFIGRVVALIGLGALTGGLLSRASGKPSSALCRRCPVIPWCDKPEAVSVRRTGGARIDRRAAEKGKPLCEDVDVRG